MIFQNQSKSVFVGQLTFLNKCGSTIEKLQSPLHKNKRRNTGTNYQLPYEVHKQLDDEHYEINEGRPQRLEKVQCLV